MRLTLFARLIISHLVLFIMLAGVSLYFIYHLSRFNQVTRSIILIDTAISEYADHLSDAFLSEVRNDRKYVVLKDEALYENYLKAHNEFNRLLDEAFTRAASEEMKHIFYAVELQHQSFSSLIKEESERIRAAKPYQDIKFAEEKKRVSDSIIAQLKNIKKTSESDVFTKIVNLSESGDKAKKFAIIISVIALSTGLVVAIIITRSIKSPLDAMRAKTVEISKGNFSGDLEVNSPPVIAELAAALNSMCHRLQAVDDIKSDFLSHMSHELRTPLASIKEGTNMLLEGLGGEGSEKQQRILRIIVQESNRMIDLVNGLLDLAKMEAGMLKYDLRPTDLDSLVKTSLESLAPLAEAKNIAIDNNIGPLLPVKVDQERIMQVFRNIIGNAIKFTPENGKIKLEARMDANENVVEILVHDNGIGLPEEDLERIFHKFQQVGRAGGPMPKGTGLGLATVKQIILAHGGRVWATSQTGQGSTFHFTLPSAA